MDTTWTVQVPALWRTPDELVLIAPETRVRKTMKIVFQQEKLSCGEGWREGLRCSAHPSLWTRPPNHQVHTAHVGRELFANYDTCFCTVTSLFLSTSNRGYNTSTVYRLNDTRRTHRRGRKMTIDLLPSQLFLNLRDIMYQCVVAGHVLRIFHPPLSHILH